MRAPPSVPLPIHRRRGALRGFVDGDRLFDLCGQQTGWIEPVFGRSPDVFDLTNRFLGELFARHHVLRYALREEPMRRAPRVGQLRPASPDPVPARDPRIPLDDRSDALPCPRSSPDRPAR